MTAPIQLTSNASVLAAKAPASGQIEYPDAKITGLALRVSGANAKSWTLRYRTGDGAQRRLSLGRYPAVGLSEARRRAQTALGAIAGGADPALDQRRSRSAARAQAVRTVTELIEAYFEDAEHGRHRQNGRSKRTSTLKMEREYFERSVRPRIGGVELKDLSRHEVQKLVDKIGSTAPSSARHCRNVIRQAFNYGLRRELVSHNPAQLVDVPSPRARERTLTDDELRAIWSACAAPHSIEGLTLSPAMGLLLRFAMTSLQRVGEVCRLHSDEIDRDRKVWTIPGTRTKNHRTHVVPLSTMALDLLDQAFVLARAAKDRGNDWVGFAFRSPRTDGPIMRHAASRAMKRLTTAIGIEDATPHDLRRTGATNITGERIRMPRFIVSRVLNQMSETGGAAAVTGVYDRNDYLTEKRRALFAWEDVLSEIVAGSASAPKIVRLVV